MMTGRSEKGHRCLRPNPTLVILLAVFLPASSVLQSDRAVAQFVPGDRDRTEPAPKPTPEGCDEVVSRPLPVENGIAQLRIINPCRKGQTLAIQTDEATFEAAFDATGALNARIPLLRDPATLRWQGQDGRPREEPARFPNIQRIVRIVLIWKGDLTLSLRVNEALSSLPGAACVWFRRGDTCRGLGRFDTLTPPDGSGTHAEIYTLPVADANRGSRLTYQVHFESQALSASNTAYCGSGRWAEPSFEVLVLNNKMIARDRRLSGFRAIPCDGVRHEPSVAQSGILLGP